MTEVNVRLPKVYRWTVARYFDRVADVSRWSIYARVWNVPWSEESPGRQQWSCQDAVRAARYGEEEGVQGTNRAKMMADRQQTTGLRLGHCLGSQETHDWVSHWWLYRRSYRTDNRNENLVTKPCLHSVVTGVLPAGWHGKFQRYDARRRYRVIRVSKYCSNRLVRMFQVSGAQIWNGLPDDVVSVPSLVTFRRHLKTYLSMKSYPNIVISVLLAPLVVFGVIFHTQSTVEIFGDHPMILTWT